MHGIVQSEIWPTDKDIKIFWPDFGRWKLLNFFVHGRYSVMRVLLSVICFCFPLSESILMKVLVAQSCPTLWDSVDCSLPGPSVYGISQARILEWVAISFSRGSSWPRDQTRVSHFAGRLLSEPPGSPGSVVAFFKCISIISIHSVVPTYTHL